MRACLFFFFLTSLFLSCSSNKQISLGKDKKSNHACKLDGIRFWNTSVDHFDQDHSRLVVTQWEQTLQERTAVGEVSFQKHWNAFNIQIGKSDKSVDQVIVDLSVLLWMHLCNLEQGLFAKSKYEQQAQEVVTDLLKAMKQRVATYITSK